MFTSSDLLQQVSSRVEIVNNFCFHSLEKSQWQDTKKIPTNESVVSFVEDDNVNTMSTIECGAKLVKRAKRDKHEHVLSHLTGKRPQTRKRRKTATRDHVAVLGTTKH